MKVQTFTPLGQRGQLGYFTDTIPGKGQLIMHVSSIDLGVVKPVKCRSSPMMKHPGPERSDWAPSLLWAQQGSAGTVSSHCHNNKPQLACFSLETVNAILHLISPGYESRLVSPSRDRTSHYIAQPNKYNHAHSTQQLRRPRASLGD